MRHRQEPKSSRHLPGQLPCWEEYGSVSPPDGVTVRLFRPSHRSLPSPSSRCSAHVHGTRWYTCPRRFRSDAASVPPCEDSCPPFRLRLRLLPLPSSRCSAHEPDSGHEDLPARRDGFSKPPCEDFCRLSRLPHRWKLLPSSRYSAHGRNREHPCAEVLSPAPVPLPQTLPGFPPARSCCSLPDRLLPQRLTAVRQKAPPRQVLQTRNRCPFRRCCSAQLSRNFRCPRHRTVHLYCTQRLTVRLCCPAQTALFPTRMSRRCPVHTPVLPPSETQPPLPLPTLLLPDVSSSCCFSPPHAVLPPASGSLCGNRPLHRAFTVSYIPYRYGY